MEDQQGPSYGDPQDLVVDIPSLAQKLEQELAGCRRLLGSRPCTPSIGLVPDLARNVDNHEYNPQYISIGPYHRTSAGTTISSQASTPFCRWRGPVLLWNTFARSHASKTMRGASMPTGLTTW